MLVIMASFNGEDLTGSDEYNQDQVMDLPVLTQDTGCKVVYGPPTREVSDSIDSVIDMAIRGELIDRDLRNSRFIVKDTITDQLTRKGYTDMIQFIYSGSVCEGIPMDRCSDLDLMVANLQYPVVLLDNPKRGTVPKTGYVIAEGLSEQPAFLRLKIVKSRKLSKEFNEIFRENDGYISSSKFVQYKASGREIHGPANVFPPESEFRDDLLSMDCVHCLISPSWPIAASEFLTRPRPSGWPSEQMIRQLKKAGCHVVGVGHPLSERKDIEWRWSFSVAERELAWDLNDTMIGCMTALKAIKQTHWNKTYPDSSTPFCSYFIKTACYWSYEYNTSSDNVVTSCHEVLDWLISCYGVKYLPHYFIPDQNLIGHISDVICKDFHDWLVDVRADIWCKIFSVFPPLDCLTQTCSDVCSKLQMHSFTKNNDYRLFVCNLNVCEDTKELVTENMKKFGPGSDDWNIRLRSRYSKVDLYPFPLMGNAEKWRNDNYQLEMLPEKIILPVIQAMSVKDEHKHFFTQLLYRSVGTTYHEWAVNYLSPKHELHRRLLAKAEYYYNLGIEITYPDGYSDKGIGGLTLLAKLYYLSEQWSKLEGILHKLQPLLEEATESVLSLCGAGGIWIDINNLISLAPWKLDTLLYHGWLKQSGRRDNSIYSVVLAYYIQIRYYLREGKTTDASETVRKLRQCDELLQQYQKLNNESTGVILSLLLQSRSHLFML